jgi:hypothetical protein
MGSARAIMAPAHAQVDAHAGCDGGETLVLMALDGRALA